MNLTGRCDASGVFSISVTCYVMIRLMFANSADTVRQMLLETVVLVDATGNVSRDMKGKPPA